MKIGSVLWAEALLKEEREFYQHIEEIILAAKAHSLNLLVFPSYLTRELGKLFPGDVSEKEVLSPFGNALHSELKRLSLEFQIDLAIGPIHRTQGNKVMLSMGVYRKGSVAESVGIDVPSVLLLGDIFFSSEAQPGRKGGKFTIHFSKEENAALISAPGFSLGIGKAPISEVSYFGDEVTTEVVVDGLFGDKILFIDAPEINFRS